MSRDAGELLVRRRSVRDQRAVHARLLLPLHVVQAHLGRGRNRQRARPERDDQVTQGRELLTTYQPDEGSAKTFCSRCGSNLFGGGWPESEECSVRLSAIDEGLEQKPESHNYVRSVAAWETLPDDGLPRYEVRST